MKLKHIINILRARANWASPSKHPGGQASLTPIRPSATCLSQDPIIQPMTRKLVHINKVYIYIYRKRESLNSDRYLAGIHIFEINFDSYIYERRPRPGFPLII